MGYKIYIPELKEVVIGVNCLFNEVIPTYTEEYFAELNKIKIETVEDASSVSNFEYLISVRYVDDESLLEFETARVTTHKGLIVGYRAPVLRDVNGRFYGHCTNARYVNFKYHDGTWSASADQRYSEARSFCDQGVCEGQDAIQ